jgi:hypothetical protein
LPEGLKRFFREPPGADVLVVAGEKSRAGLKSIKRHQKQKDAVSGKESRGPSFEEPLLEAAMYLVKVIGRVEVEERRPLLGSDVDVKGVAVERDVSLRGAVEVQVKPMVLGPFLFELDGVDRGVLVGLPKPVLAEHRDGGAIAGARIDQDMRLVLVREANQRG